MTLELIKIFESLGFKKNGKEDLITLNYKDFQEAQNKNKKADKTVVIASASASTSASTSSPAPVQASVSAQDPVQAPDTNSPITTYQPIEEGKEAFTFSHRESELKLEIIYTSKKSKTKEDKQFFAFEIEEFNLTTESAYLEEDFQKKALKVLLEDLCKRGGSNNTVKFPRNGAIKINGNGIGGFSDSDNQKRSDEDKILKSFGFLTSSYNYTLNSDNFFKAQNKKKKADDGFAMDKSLTSSTVVTPANDLLSNLYFGENDKTGSIESENLKLDVSTPSGDDKRMRRFVCSKKGEPKKLFTIEYRHVHNKKKKI